MPLSDAYNTAFQALSATSLEALPHQLKTNSRPKEFLTGRVLESDIFVTQNVGNNKEFLQKKSLENERVFQIASITKTFTAAALVRMTANEIYSHFFNLDDPIGTPISQFKGLIEKHGNKNQKKYFEELNRSHPRYSEVTLRHLLNHTSGMIENFWNVSDLLDFRSNQSQNTHLESSYSSPQINPSGFGKFSYCDNSYNNVLRAVMESVAMEAKGRPVKLSEIVKEEIITPLKLTKTFMPDEMEYKKSQEVQFPDSPLSALGRVTEPSEFPEFAIDSVEQSRVKETCVKDSSSSQVTVKGRPEIEVAQGYDYFEGKVTSGQDFNYDSAAGGIYSTAEEVSKFYQAILDGRLFSAAAEKIFFDPKNFVPSDDERNKSGQMFEGYGLGVRRIENQGVEYFHHGGAGLGFYSYVIGQRKSGVTEVGDEREVIVSSVILAYENLTRPIAASLLGDEKKDEKGNFFVDEELTKKMDELAATYSQVDLIEMRTKLEEIEEENSTATFQETSQKFQSFFEEKFLPKTYVTPNTGTTLSNRGQPNQGINNH